MVKYRGLDCEIALKYGIRMCSGDTIGPGGIMRTIREFPKIQAYCRDIEALCPDAWGLIFTHKSCCAQRQGDV